MTLEKKIIVIAGINLVEGGPLSVFHDFLKALIKNKYTEKYKVIALVGRKDLFSQFEKKIKLLEFAKSKTNWLYRLYYEYFYFKKLSKKLTIHIWISLHDITSNVISDKRYVYCHNPSPFNKMTLFEARFGIKYYLFSKFYKYIYAINIKKNDAVIVQQDWMRQAFKKMFDLQNVIVARPSIEEGSITPKEGNNRVTTFIMPSFPRYYKNFEIGCQASKMLEERGICNFKVFITLDGSENKYSSYLKQKYKKCKCIDFCGILDREELFAIYSMSDCLLFMSKLETWGMPITEYKVLQKPMIVADLPYAHETVGNYKYVEFIGINDAKALSEAMEKVINGGTLTKTPTETIVETPYANNWDELCNLLF